METEDIKYTQELEELRAQYAALKEQVENSRKINEKRVLSSMRRDLNTVNKKKWLSLFAGIAAAGMLFALYEDLGLDDWFLIVSLVWFFIMIVCNFIRLKDVHLDSLSAGTSKEFLEEMKKRKNSQFRWFRINFSLFFIWVAVFIAECLTSGMSHEMLVPLICGIIAGALVGVILGFRMHNRIIGTYEGIIAEIENPES